MKKKALQKDFRVEVKKSLNRFLSIFFIVALGVAFFAGIQAAAPDMRATGDWYFDQNHLMDIRVISTLGITENDLQAIRDIEGVSEIHGSYMQDVYCGEEDSREVLHVEALTDGINIPAVTEGSLPEHRDECFLDISYAEKMGYRPGDTLEITVESEEDSILKEHRFRISGIGYSPCYISIPRGSTTLGNGSLSGFAYVLPEAFDSEVYTTAYVIAEGSMEKEAYTDGYDDLIEEVQSRIEAIEDLRCEIRYQEIMQEAEEKLSDARQEVEDGKKELSDARQELADGESEAESELTAAKSELTEGETKLSDGKQELFDACQEVEDGEIELSDGEKELLENEQKLSDGQRQIQEGIDTLNEGEQEYKEGLDEYKKESAKAKKEMTAAQKQIDDGRSRLSAGWETYQTSLSEIENGELQLSAAEAQLQNQQAAYDAGAAQFADGKTQYDQAAAQLPALQQGYADAMAQAGNLEVTCGELRAQAEAMRAACDQDAAAADSIRSQEAEARNAASSLYSQADGRRQEKAGFENTLNEKQGQLDQLRNSPDESEEKQQQIAALENEIAGLGDQIVAIGGEIGGLERSAAEQNQRADELAGQAAALEGGIGEKQAAAEAAEQGLQEASLGLEAARSTAAGLQESINTIQANGAQLSQKEAELSAAAAQLAAGWQALEQKRQELQNGRAQLEQARASLEANEQQLASAEKELNAGKKKLNAAKKKLTKARTQLDNGWAKLNKSQQELADGSRQIEDGKTKLSDARKKLEDARREIADGQKELEENEQKLKDGWKEYEEGKKEAEEKIADGKAKIRDAEQELKDAEEKIADAEEKLSEIKKPVWYVTNRSSLPENTGFGENAERMSNIAKVIPLLFFLVAALISLTTMTRMVEEERTQIGTLKALGYGKWSIASKYMKYAFLATVGGSITGVLIGEKIFPWVIINAYGIMFQYLPKMIIPYNLTYGGIATGAALICTMGATLSACYKELLAVPAELMRPPAPKQGKRVFLERITFFWNHLSFSWKSTVRNLIRYKKRFLMTIIGIGGCMGLLLLGYGLQDSITGIGILQYEELQLHSAMAILDTEESKAEQEKPLEILKKNDKVTAYKHFYVQQQDVNTEGLSRKEWAIYVYVPENLDNLDKFLRFKDRKTGKSYELTDEGAIITEKISTELGLSAGDMIPLKREGEPDIQVPILAITENYLSHYLYMTPAFYEKLYGKPPEYNSILWTSAEDQAGIEVTGEELLELDAVLNINYTGTMAETIDNMLGAMDVVMLVIIASAGMLAFVVLYNLNNININERRRELATLKVLGFYDGEVAIYVYRENILLTMIGAALGILIGKVLHLYVIQTVEVDACMFGRVINPVSYVYATLFTIGFSIIVNAVMYFKLQKIDMVESLKSIE